MIQIPIEMPQNCHECDSFGISDLYGFECPVNKVECGYDFIKRPDGCPLKEGLSDKEKDYLYGILCKQDWTEQSICDGIANKLKLLKHD